MEKKGEFLLKYDKAVMITRFRTDC